jgi:uncharacterized membrane protein YbaN (DUF454 family)
MSLQCSGMALVSTPHWFGDFASATSWQMTDGGVATFHSPRLIGPGRERFFRLLADKAARLPGVLRVALCTATSVWRVEFSTEALGVEDVSAHLIRSLGEAIPALRASGTANGCAMSWVAFPKAVGPASVWEFVKKAPARFQLRSRRLRRRPALASRVARSLEQLRGVRKCWAEGRSGTIELEIDEAMVSPLDLATSAEELSRRRGRLAIGRALARRGRFWLVRSRRLGKARDLLLAGGSFLMVVVGVVLPGIPSAPFLLLTAYFLLRCWPGLRGVLGNFPRLMRVLDAPFPHPTREDIAKSVIIAVLSILLFLIAHPPLPLVFGFELCLAAIYARRWIRQADEPENGLTLALPHP